MIFFLKETFSGSWIYFGLLLEEVHDTFCFCSTVFCCCLFKALHSQTPSVLPLIGQLTHAWARTAQDKRAIVLNQFFCVLLAAGHR